LCWSHLIRDFRKIVDRGGKSRVIGECLLRASEDLFHDWHLVRDGKMSRKRFRRRARRIRKRVHALLEIGTASPVFGVAGMCRGILELEPAMWTFVNRLGVEPTNNAAERLIRPAVIWRKTSMGTQSPAGSRFTERILTCVATLRQQGRNVLEYLTAVRCAALNGVRAPPLIA
jgi:transposase